MKVRYAFKHTAAAPGAVFYTFKHIDLRFFSAFSPPITKTGTDKTDETYYTGGSLLSSCLC